MKQPFYIPVSGLILSTTLSLILLGCGLKTNLPTPSRSPEQTTEKAVEISGARFANDGVQITCQINSALVSPDVSLVLFLEFEGTMVESIPLQNTQSHEFNKFMPDRDGYILCVVVYAEAEFASDGLMLEQDDF